MLCELIISAVVIFVIYLKWKYSFWSRQNIDGPTPIPFIGNLLDYILCKKHFSVVYSDIYKQYPKAKYVGFYKLNKPAIVIRDIDLVQKVLVNDFASFLDNDIHVNESLDPLQSASPFTAHGENWRVARKQVTPIFTGSKVKAVLPNLQNVAKKLAHYIRNEEKNNPDGFEAKELSIMFTIENIASAGFGVEGGTFDNTNSKFYEIAYGIFAPGTSHYFRLMVILFAPIIGTIFRIAFIPNHIQKWVKEFVSSIKTYREENGIQRNDFIQTLLQLRDKNIIGDQFLYGYSLLIFVEAYETSSALMANALYQIARSTEIQQKLHDEVVRVKAKYDRELSDEGINVLEYMDMVLYETLRLQSPIFSLLKICTKLYELPPQYPNSKTGLVIEPGTPVIIPSYAIHLDSQYYENAESFIPERFTEENKRNRNRYTFLGFGEGLRICPGMKLAMAQVKLGIASLVENFEINLTPKTIEPLRICAKSFALFYEDGIWLKFKSRN